MTRVRGYAPWRPQKKTQALLAQVDNVLEEYREHLPLTIRQIFYRLVGSVGYDKTEAAYGRLCETISRARRAGLISFEAIRDDGGTRIEPNAWGGVGSFKQAVANTAKNFRLDRQKGQELRLWLLCEAGGMAPMLARVADAYGVPVLSSGGFDSLTAKHELAREIVDAEAAQTEVLHVGDYDPSGVHLFNALVEDVSAMVRELGGPEVSFVRLAVKPEQIADMGLPSAPPKKTDNRAFADDKTVQAEAIPPDILSKLVKDAIEARQRSETRAGILALEQANRQELSEWIAV